MEDESTIDIIMPTYNGEKYLEQQLQSLLEQSYQNIRIIISDDNSSDNTTDILKKYKEKDKRIEIYFQEKNLGVVKNIEFLLKKVENPFYMLCDQDDYWLPEKVQKSIDTLKQNDADLVFGDLEVVDENLNTIYPSYNDFMHISRKIKNNINKKDINYLYNCVTGCTILAKKETISWVLPIPIKSGFSIHDHWIGIMSSINGKLAYIQEKYIKYRQHGDNQVGATKITHKYTKMEPVREFLIDVKLGIFETYEENNDKFPKEMQELNRNALNYFKTLKQKKLINFKNWKIFYQLYKSETFTYFIENFIIMNLPIIGKPLFKIRWLILRLMKKR